MSNSSHTIGQSINNKVLKRLLQYFIASVLLVTGIGKLLDVPGFIEVLKTYNIFPHSILPFIAVGLVLTELRLAETLFRGVFLFKAAIFSIGLHGMFTIVSIITLLRDLEIPNCGCFGVFWARPLTWITVLEDLFMIMASCGLAYLANRNSRPFNSIPGNKF